MYCKFNWNNLFNGELCLIDKDLEMDWSEEYWQVLTNIFILAYNLSQSMVIHIL